MKRTLIVIAALAALAVPASANAYVSTSTARNVAGSYAMRNWDPVMLLPSYSLALNWDGVNHDQCFRFGANNLHCVVSVDASDYTVDSFDNPFGFAWCDATVVVKRQYGYLSVRTLWGGMTCDSTDDLNS